MTFSSYVQDCLLFEREFQDIVSHNDLDQVSYSEFMKKNHGKPIDILIQIYILALIIGISKEDLESTPNIFQDKNIGKLINQAFMKTTDFKEDFRELVNNIPKEKLSNIEDPETKKVIELLADRYGQQLDRQSLGQNIPQSFA